MLQVPAPTEQRRNNGTEECIKLFDTIHPTESGEQSQSLPLPTKHLRSLAAVLNQIQDDEAIL